MSQNLGKWRSTNGAPTCAGTCIKRSARCDRNFCLCLFYQKKKPWFPSFSSKLYMWRNINFFSTLKWTVWEKTSTQIGMRYGRVYHVTGSQWRIIDSIMLCPWSCINQESLFSVPDGFQEVVFFFGGNVFAMVPGEEKTRMWNSQICWSAPSKCRCIDFNHRSFPLGCLCMPYPKQHSQDQGLVGALLPPESFSAPLGTPWGWQEQRLATSVV